MRAAFVEVIIDSHAAAGADPRHGQVQAHERDVQLIDAHGGHVMQLQSVQRRQQGHWPHKKTGQEGNRDGELESGDDEGHRLPVRNEPRGGQKLIPIGRGAGGQEFRNRLGDPRTGQEIALELRDRCNR